MSIASYFEDFSMGPTTPPNGATESGDPLEGYETGYKAGWDDATKAQKDTDAHLSSTLTRNLEQIEFTVAEAQAQLLTSLAPVLDGITLTLFPGLSSQALRALLHEEITKLLRVHSAGEIALLISQDDETTLASFLNSTRELSEVKLDVRDTLSEGQAYVTCAGKQRKIDVAEAISDITKALDDFINQPELEQAHAS